MNTKEREESLTLEILETIEQHDDVTQRHLADRLGVALGLTNSYLKRCARKGLIKIHQAPANRYLYYLTPKGFTEKSRLTAKYLSVSFDFYRQAGSSLNQIYRECENNRWKKVLLCGISELAEIASIRALEHEIEIVGIFDPNSELNKFLNLPVWHSFDEGEKYDCCILTTLSNPDEFYEMLIKLIDKDRILLPKLLGLNKQRN